jgi:hypothetical protein
MSPPNLSGLIRYGIFGQYSIVDHNKKHLWSWSLDPKDKIELLYHQATPLIV